MKNRNLKYIIDASEERSTAIYIRDIILTAIVWILYFYFMRDFFVFIGDVFTWAIDGFGDTEQYPNFKILGTILSYLQALAAMTVLFIGWSLYNIIRYGKKKRRKTTTAVEIAQTAQAYSIDAGDLGKWQKSRILVIHHDGRGHITDVVVEK